MEGVIWSLVFVTETPVPLYYSRQKSTYERHDSGPEPRRACPGPEGGGVMTGQLLRRIIVPIANEADTKATCDALLSYLDEMVELVNVLHVIEQTEGYIDPSSPEAIEQEAGEWFDIAESRLEAGDAFQTELRAGTDVIDQIVASASEHDATAIVFRPRQSGRLSGVFSRDLKDRLLTENPCPVIVLPDKGRDT